MSSSQTRREFLARAGGSISSALFAVQFPLILSTANLACAAREAGESFVSFSPTQGLIVDALSDMIIPGGETPGAKDAGVVHFIDQSLTTFAAPLKSSILTGIDAFGKQISPSSDLASGIDAFSASSWDDRAEHIIKIEQSEFFGQFSQLTVMGMFSNPKHGGNKDKMGWDLLGFDDRHAWTPPFGYYDADAHSNGVNK